ncbi:MAG: phosphatase PAP2 family protein [Candidatus Pacebacteria bacterium]|nr:phosphatase PAP2 family protein [Candidatus Paceibacterota bacterium]
MYSLDLDVFYALHSLAGQSGWLDALIVFFGEYVLYILLALLAYLILRAAFMGDMKKAYAYCGSAFGALLARFGVEPFIHLFYQRERPFLALHVSHLLTDTTYSFPSGHTIFLFALATGMYFVHKPLGYLFFAAGLLVGLARVISGVHYPTDILGGIVLGTCTGALFFVLWQSVGRRFNLALSK